MYKELKQNENFNDTYSSWIIAYCLDTNSFFITNQRHFFWEYDTEIFMDVNLTHYPLRDYCSMWNELQNIVRQYGKIGKRNEKAIEHGKIAKHSMHLIRLYMMCLDILEKERIITYREDEHDLLMDIRNGKYLDSNDQPIPEFFEMVNDYEKRLDYAKKNTNLPDNPDYKKINEFFASVNERVVKGEI